MSFKVILDLTVTINLLNIKLRHFLTIAIDRKLLCIINFFWTFFLLPYQIFQLKRHMVEYQSQILPRCRRSYTIKLNMIV